MPKVTIYQGNCLDVLPALNKNSVHTCVTSPPYFGLRDYGHQGQVGLEQSPYKFIDELVKVFDGVRHVLCDDGTIWINIGDSYAANRSYQVADSKHTDVGNTMGMKVPEGMKAKDLMMVPARLAIALQDAGWYLRSDVIWHKPNAMPESVRDRPINDYEHIFLLSKKQKYYYDHIATKTEAKNGKMRGLRAVWSVNTKPFSDAHFATFPPELIEPCIKAGAHKGRCSECDTEMILEEIKGEPISDGIFTYDVLENVSKYTFPCDCNGEINNAVVLDPFFGSGTTGLVATQQGCDCIGVELNPEYIEIAKRRLGEGGVDVEVITT